MTQFTEIPLHYPRSSGEVVSYNTINTRETRNSKVIKQSISLIGKNTNITLYSNQPQVVWFLMRRDVLLLPWLPKQQSFNQSMVDKLTGWPPQKEAYIIWLKPDLYEVTVTPDELSKVTSLKLIYDFPDGDIYFVRAKD